MKKIFIVLILSILLFSITAISATDVTDIATNDQVTNSTIISSDLEMTYKDGSFFEATFLDKDGSPLKNATVQFNIVGKTYSKITDDNGIAGLKINLNPGNYKITAIHPDGTQQSNDIFVKKPIVSSDLEMSFKDGSVFESTFLKNGVPLNDTTIQFNIVGKTYSKVTDENGIARLNINLGPGNYVITSIHPDGFTQSNNIFVKKPIVSSDLEMYFKDGSAFEATFLKNGVPLNNTTIQFNIVGKTYSKVTDSKGVARLNINLVPGNYVITSIHPDGFSQSNNIIVNSKTYKPSIIGSDLEMVYKDGSAFEATFLEDGVPLKEGTTVQFNIVGKNYSKLTDANGTARLNINLGPGNYVITAIHPYDLSCSYSITVLLNVNTTDLRLYCHNGSSFVASVTDGKGNPVKDIAVQFGIIGKNYSKLTDANGTARLNINLGPGEYIITTLIPSTGFRVSNKITVLPVIYCDDLVMYYKNGSAFEATFLDGFGNILNNTAIQFGIVGKTYTRITDENGVARLNINLGPGEYIIDVIHPNGFILSKKVTVLSTIKVINQIAASSPNTVFKVKLLDNQGNPLVNSEAILNINGNIRSERTNDKGIAIFHFPLKIGNYVGTYTNSKDGLTQSFNIQVLHAPGNLEGFRYDNMVYLSGNLVDRRDNEVSSGQISVYKDDSFLGNCAVDYNGNFVFPWDITNEDVIGEDITIRITYSGGYSVPYTSMAKLFKFNENLDTTIITDSYTKSGNVYNIKSHVIDETGKRVLGGSVEVTFNGNTYLIPVDSNGDFSFKVGNFNNNANYQILIQKWGSYADVTQNKVLMDVIEHTELTDHILSLYPQGIPIIKFGNGNGPTIVLNAGLHGAELSSIVASFKVINVLANYGSNIDGTIYICPILFPDAVANNVRVYNGINLNTIAYKKGSLSNHIATFAKSVGASALGDFHCTRHSDSDVGITCAICSKSPTYGSYLIAKYISSQTGYTLSAYSSAGSTGGALENYCNIIGVASTTCEALSNHKSVDYGAPELSYNMQRAFLNYFGFNINEMIKIPLPTQSGSYDLTINYLGEYNYNPSSTSLREIVV